MPSLGDVKNILMNTLVEMGYNPYSLQIKSFETETADGHWSIDGEFRGGYVGEVLTFHLKYDPITNGISKIKISAGSSETGYA